MSLSITVMSKTELMVTSNGKEFHKIVDPKKTDKKKYFNHIELLNIITSLATSSDIERDFSAQYKHMRKVIFSELSVPTRAVLANTLLSFMATWERACKKVPECDENRPPSRAARQAENEENGTCDARLKKLIERLRETESELTTLREDHEIYSDLRRNELNVPRSRPTLSDIQDARAPPLTAVRAPPLTPCERLPATAAARRSVAIPPTRKVSRRNTPREIPSVPLFNKKTPSTAQRFPHSPLWNGAYEVDAPEQDEISDFDDEYGYKPFQTIPRRKEVPTFYEPFEAQV